MWSAFPEHSWQGRVTCLVGSAAPHGPFWRNTRLCPHWPWCLTRADHVDGESPFASPEPLAAMLQGQARMRGSYLLAPPHLGTTGSYTPLLKTQSQYAAAYADYSLMSSCHLRSSPGSGLGRDSLTPFRATDGTGPKKDGGRNEPLATVGYRLRVVGIAQGDPGTY